MKLFGRKIGRGQPLFLVAGPCVIESRENALATAVQLAAISQSLDVLIIYKSSFDKGNRTSGRSFRGPGLHEGLEILQMIKAQGFEIEKLLENPKRLAPNSRPTLLVRK